MNCKKEPQNRTRQKTCCVFFLVLDFNWWPFWEGCTAARPEPGGCWLCTLWQCHHVGPGHGEWRQLLHAGPGERPQGKLGASLVAVSECLLCVCVAAGERQYLEVEDEAHEGAEMMGWGRGEGRWRDHREKIIEVRNGVCPEHKQSFFHDEFFRVDVTQLAQMPTGLSRPHRWVECAGKGWSGWWQGSCGTLGNWGGLSVVTPWE